MNNLNYFKIIKKNIGLVISVVLLVVVIGLAFTVFQPFKYRSSIQLLIIEQGQGLDAYSAIRSAEKVSNNLAYILYTNSFMDRVTSGNTAGFPVDPFERKKEWKKAVVAKVVPETGILNIDVYHQDRNQALVLSENIGRAFSAGSVDYTGNQNIVVKVIDQPIASRYPVKPNIALNIITSIALGLILSISYIFLAGSFGLERKVLSQNVLATKESEASELVNQSRNVEGLPVSEPVMIPAIESLAPALATIQDDVAAAAAEDKEDAKAFYKMLFPEN